MGASQCSRRTDSRWSRIQPSSSAHHGLRGRPTWLGQSLLRVACCLALTALGVLLVPAVALSATIAQIFPGFAGGKLGGGTSIRFRFAVSESAGGLPQAATRAIVHIPKGTALNLTRVPTADRCSTRRIARRFVWEISHKTSD
jgi:hypothetical protein